MTEKYVKALANEFMRQIDPGFELIYNIGHSGIRNIRKVLREFNHIPHVSSALYKLEKYSPTQTFLTGVTSGNPLVVKHRQTRFSLLPLEGRQYLQHQLYIANSVSTERFIRKKYVLFELNYPLRVGPGELGDFGHCIVKRDGIKRKCAKAFNYLSLHQKLIRTDNYLRHNDLIKAFPYLHQSFQLLGVTKKKAIPAFANSYENYLTKLFSVSTVSALDSLSEVEIIERWVDFSVKHAAKPSINELKTATIKTLANSEVFAAEQNIRKRYKSLHSAITSLSTTPVTRYANGQNIRAKVYDPSASANPFHVATAGKDASSVTHGIIIHGNQRFQREVIKHLDTINTPPSGKRLIERLEHKKVDIIPPSYGDVRRVQSREGEKVFLSDNSCNGKTIIFDPENEIMGTNIENLVNEPWRKRNPDIALYHEMLHSYFHYHHQNIYDPTGKRVFRVNGGSAFLDEARITGTVYKHNGQEFNFYDSGYLATIDDETKYFTENNFRKEMAQAYRQDYYYIRPVYGSGSHQIRIK